MSENFALYPWLLNYRWLFEILFGGFAMVFLTYLWLRTGRDRLDEEPVPEKEPLQDYAGLIQQSPNKVPVFLIVLNIGVALWAIGYIIHTALVGGLGY